MGSAIWDEKKKSFRFYFAHKLFKKLMSRFIVICGTIICKDKYFNN